jgi:hypothetical protein
MTRSQSDRSSLLAVASVLLLGACATTKMDSTVNPGATEHQFQRVMVMFPLSPFEKRALVEKTFAEESTDGTTFIPSYPVLVAGIEYSHEEIARIVENHEVDAILELSLISSTVRFQSVAVQGTAFDVYKPEAEFELRLVCIEDGIVMWSSTAESKGGALADADDLLRSLARKTVKQLAEDGLTF